MMKKQAEQLLSKMSLLEKCELLYGDGFWKTHSNERLGIASLRLSDGPHGLRTILDSKKEGDIGSLSLKATCFPTASLSACSFDEELLYELGQCLAIEALHQGIDVVLGPGVNIKRNPLCGRNFEYFSEDPYLAGKLGSAFIKGLQDTGVGCSLKHFACNSQETNRLYISSTIDERAFRDIYLKQFEMIVKDAKPWTIMCSYNRINDVYSSDNKYLLTDILRDEWGFDGLVMTDWGAMNEASIAYASGLNLEMPYIGENKKALAKLVKHNKLSIKDIDKAALDVIKLALKAKSAKKQIDSCDYDAHYKLALKIAEKSIVLAKNENILPLNSFDDVGVIGLFAKNGRYQGTGSSRVNAYKTKSFLDALDERNIKYEYSGCYDEKGLMNDDDLVKAINIAKHTKTLVVFLGLPEAYESEGFDREDMSLPISHIKLIDELVKINDNVVVILECGSPVELPFIAKIKGLVVSYLAGEAYGEAILNVLVGNTNPSGRFAETWPLSYRDNIFHNYFPGSNRYVTYKESIFVGYRYYDKANKNVLFPFGYGLSYSSFSFSNFMIDKLADNHFVIRVDVKNNSDIDGSDIVQFYIANKNEISLNPVRELKDFKKVTLKAHEQITVTFNITSEAFEHFDSFNAKTIVEPGQYDLEIARSSRDIIHAFRVDISSFDEVEDVRSFVPSYFALDKVKDISDEEFALLYKSPLPKEYDTHKRPFTKNSTIGDIENTFVGKILIKAYRKMLKKNKSMDEATFKMLDKSLLATPLRAAMMSGIVNARGINGIVKMANRHFISGFFLLVFGGLNLK